MALYILLTLLAVLLIIRFTHPTQSVFYVDGCKVTCRKEDVNKKHYISYAPEGGKKINVWYRTKLSRDRAYLSLTVGKVREVTLI